MAVKIYHNSRCSKSRAGLEEVTKLGVEFEIIKYLDNPLTAQEIEDILHKLDMKPIELVRVKETVWKEEYKDKELSDQEIILAMAENPKLIERPIVEKGDKAVLGRPTEKIADFLK